jgi:flagellar protein FliJ
MNASNPLDTLIEQSRKARDQAGRSLADDRRGQAQSAAQLDALRRYRQEYCRRLQDAMGRGIDAATLANYRRFIRSLDDAIDAALRALDQQQEKVAASQQHWKQRQRQLSSYDTLASRRAEQARQQEQRRERRDNDEQTNNAIARRARRD